MLFWIYWDGHYVGTVIAADEADARLRAEEKFGPIWGLVEVRSRQKTRAVSSPHPLREALSS